MRQNCTNFEFPTHVSVAISLRNAGIMMMVLIHIYCHVKPDDHPQGRSDIALTMFTCCTMILPLVWREGFRSTPVTYSIIKDYQSPFGYLLCVEVSEK